MIPNEVAQAMLLARDYGLKFSNCSKRKIGSAIQLDNYYIFGANKTRYEKDCCKDRASCLAVHSEVDALSMIPFNLEDQAKKIFCWCEIPCVSCLRTLRVNSSITTIYCLSVESYGVIYPAVLERTLEINKRKTLSATLGIDVVELDMKELEEQHELHRQQPTINVLPKSNPPEHKDLSGGGLPELRRCPDQQWPR